MSGQYKMKQHRSSDHNDGHHSLPDRLYFESRTDVQENKDIRLRKLLGLLSTDVQQLTTSLWKDLDNEKDDLQTKENEIFTLKNKNKTLKDEIERLKSEASSTMKNEADATTKTLQRKISEFEKRAEYEKRAREEAEKKYQVEQKTHAETLKTYQQTIDKQTIEIQILQKEKRKATEELLTSSEQHAIINTSSEMYDNLEKQLRKAKEELKNTKAELEYTKTRLSESMGAKLLDKNPDIADLSDRNRPTKLAERFQEIYDNEWTDAFEVIGKNNDDDEKTVSVLASILTETKKFCDHEADNQMKEIQMALLQEPTSGHLTRSSIPAHVSKQLKDSRKSLAELSGKQLYKKYEEGLRVSSSSTARQAKLVPKFLEACFNICWMMAIQDPPVVFGPDVRRGDTFDTDVYKAYTKNGKTVAYVVWPALLLHTNGPVLCKGVAQGIEDSSRRPKSAPPSSTRTEYQRDSRGRPISNDMHISDLDQNGQYLQNDNKYNQDLKLDQYHGDFGTYHTIARDDYTSNDVPRYSGTESHSLGYDRRMLRHDFGSRVYDQSLRDDRSEHFDYKSNPKSYHSNTRYIKPVTQNFDNGTPGYPYESTQYSYGYVHRKRDTASYASDYRTASNHYHSYLQTTTRTKSRFDQRHTDTHRRDIRPAWRV